MSVNNCLASRLCQVATAVALLAVSTVTADAAILYQSPLTAPPLVAADLVGQDGWAAHSGAGAKAIQVGASGTTLQQSAGSGEDINQSITTMGAGQTYYFGFDLINSGGSADVYFAHFMTSSTLFRNRLFVTSATSGGDYTLGIGTGAAPAVKWGSDLSFGTSYRVVGSYAFDSGEIKLWVDPLSIASTSISSTDALSAAVNAFGFRQASPSVASSQLVSDLVIADDFNSAAGVIPEPTTVALALVGLAGLAVRRRR